MIEFALNHMTVLKASWSALVDIAARLGASMELIRAQLAAVAA